ncbi:conserved hypothetical protein, partial [Listeria seeligeri FSL S4-171]
MDAVCNTIASKNQYRNIAPNAAASHQGFTFNIEAKNLEISTSWNCQRMNPILIASTIAIL